MVMFSREMKIGLDSPIKMAAYAFFAAVLYGANLELYDIAYDTGDWWSGFSLKWGIIFIVFIIVSLLYLLALGIALWRSANVDSLLKAVVDLRGKLGCARWLLSAGIVMIPVWLLQYSSWGVILDKTNLRLLVWSLIVLLLAFFITTDEIRAWAGSGILTAFFISATVFSFFAPLRNVTSFPFSLGWS